MLKRLFSSNRTDKPLVNPKYLRVKSGENLLHSKVRQTHLRKIKRLLSVTDEIWKEHYLYAISRFCELVQDVPASELHHHNYQGGLIDHTLEALHIGVKASHGFVMPPNCDPESIAGNADKWRFGAFIAILGHDLGKIVTDLEVVYRTNNEFTKWMPWFGFMPLDAEYIFRYKERVANPSTSKSMHEKASMSLLPLLLTEKACLWLFSDQELIAQLFSSVTNTAFGGDVIHQIVKTADMSSVSDSMGGGGGASHKYQSSNKPLQEKVLNSLIVLLNDGTLKRNKPGAAVWITKEYTWVVSKTSMEAVKSQLQEEGHKGIPKNVVRLFSVLNENNLIIKTKNGDSVWKAEVNDFANGWKQTLTFLKFENSVLWPTSVPSLFDGDIISEDGDEVEIIEQAQRQVGDLTENRLQETKSIITKVTSEPIAPPPVKSKERMQVVSKKKSKVTEVNTKKLDTLNGAGPNPNPMDIDFFVWMHSEIRKLKLRVNEPKSPVHFTKDYIVLVTPSIFVRYLKSNPIKETTYKAKAGSKLPFTALQREIESLQIHRRSPNGTNICKIKITGSKKQASINCYVLRRQYFPELNNFNANSALSIE